MELRFDDKVVVITGASRGLGRAIAIAFAKEGAKVVANYKKMKKQRKKHWLNCRNMIRIILYFALTLPKKKMLRECTIM